ncbi:unnamed protein product [Strongylus vulgaris]|uniref:Uncharacterized protein n=1 Tax=Strongylus vulgaris TaxID=40348 RepID=A0A3P7L5Q0_STRVU|nr:unnamed protein product [Strongylus vulgaris]
MRVNKQKTCVLGAKFLAPPPKLVVGCSIAKLFNPDVILYGCCMGAQQVQILIPCSCTVLVLVLLFQNIREPNVSDRIRDGKLGRRQQFIPLL